MHRIVFYLLVMMLLNACTAAIHKDDADPSRLQYLEGVVQDVSGNEITVSVNLPEIKKTSDTPIGELARLVVKKTLIIEGSSLEVDNEKGSVTSITDKIIKITLKQTKKFKTGSIVRLKLYKKRIAVSDFSIIRGGAKEASAIVMEDLTSALVESGTLTVVERAKLQAIMDEMKLRASGLTEDVPEKLRQKLMIADIILTGTIAEVDNEYNINLRIINVFTGQILSAINIKTPIMKIVETRDFSELNDNFEENSGYYSWNQGPSTKSGYVSIDHNVGAGGSQKSIKLDYDFKNKKGVICPAIKNSKKRDFSFYKGVEFLVKGTQVKFGYVNIETSDRDEPDRRDRWFSRYPIDTDWKVVRIPFEQFAYLQSKVLLNAGFKKGKQVKDMSHVEALIFGTCNYLLRDANTSGAIWIDNIKLYK